MGRAFGKRQPQQIQQAAPAQIAPQTTAASATVQQPPMNLPGQPISIMGQPTTPGPGISLPGQPTTARLAGTPLQNRQALAQQQMLAGMPTGLHLNPTAAIDAQLAQMGLRPMADKMVDFIVQNSHDVTKLESLNRMMGNRLDIATLQYVARQGHDATLRYIARTVAGWQGARTQMIGSVADLRARFLSEDKADQARLKTIQDGITSANKILQNPKATAEAKATAQSQLNDLYARQTGIYQEIANRMREMNQAQWGAMSPFLGEQQPSDMTPDDLEIVRSLYQD
jgi:hypothetical protein